MGSLELYGGMDGDRFAEWILSVPPLDDKENRIREFVTPEHAKGLWERGFAQARAIELDNPLGEVGLKALATWWASGAVQMNAEMQEHFLTLSAAPGPGN